VVCNSAIFATASETLETVYTLSNFGLVTVIPAAAGASLDFVILSATAVLKASFSSAVLQELKESAAIAAHAIVRSFFINSTPF